MSTDYDHLLEARGFIPLFETREHKAGNCALWTCLYLRSVMLTDISDQLLGKSLDSISTDGRSINVVHLGVTSEPKYAGCSSSNAEQTLDVSMKSMCSICSCPNFQFSELKEPIIIRTTLSISDCRTRQTSFGCSGRTPVP